MPASGVAGVRLRRRCCATGTVHLRTACSLPRTVSCTRHGLSSNPRGTLVELPFPQGKFMVTTLLSSARVALLAAAVTSAAAGAMQGSERISIRVTPSVALSPADVTINAIVEPNAANEFGARTAP
jgi:hypothetical protein